MPFNYNYTKLLPQLHGNNVLIKLFSTHKYACIYVRKKVTLIFTIVTDSSRKRSLTIIFAIIKNLRAELPFTRNPIIKN